MVTPLASSFSLSEANDGVSVTENFYVEYSGPQAGTSGALYDVLVQNSPERGTPHPTIPNIVLVSREVEAMGNAMQFKVTLKWGVPSGDDAVGGVTQIRTGSGSASEQLSIDLTGAPIRTVLDVPVTLPNGSTTIRTDEQVHAVDVERPSTTSQYEKVVEQDPTADSMFYVGKVNAISWKGGAAGTWLCTGIEGQSDDGGETYKVTYSFQFNPQGWNPIVRHRDPQTGLPFFGNPALNPGAVINPTVYQTASFAALGL